MLADLDRPQYMQLPPSLPRYSPQGERLVARLSKSLYGLSQAGRQWSILLATFLTEYGMTRSTIDPCLFMLAGGAGRPNDKLVVVVWVDDLVIATNSPALRDKFVKDLHARFPVDDKGELRWILGLEVTRDRAKRTLRMVRVDGVTTSGH